MKSIPLTGALVGLCVSVLSSCGESGNPASAANITAADADSRGTATPTVAATPGASGAGSSVPGRLLAANCFQCHGTDGHPAGGFDEIAGESVSEIVEELTEFRQKDEGIMSVHARGYSEAQVRQLAEYLSTR